MNVAELAGLLDAQDIAPNTPVYVLVDGTFRRVRSAAWRPMDVATGLPGKAFDPSSTDCAVITLEYGSRARWTVPNS